MTYVPWDTEQVREELGFELESGWPNRLPLTHQPPSGDATNRAQRPNVRQPEGGQCTKIMYPCLSSSGMLILIMMPQSPCSAVGKGQTFTTLKLHVSKSLSPTSTPVGNGSTAQEQNERTVEKRLMVSKLRWLHSQEVHSCREYPSGRLQRRDKDHFRHSTPAGLRHWKAQLHPKLMLLDVTRT